MWGILSGFFLSRFLEQKYQYNCDMNEKRHPDQLNLSFEDKLPAAVEGAPEQDTHEPSEEEVRLAGEMLPLAGIEIQAPNRAEERKQDAEAKKARERLRHQLSEENLLNQVNKK